MIHCIPTDTCYWFACNLSDEAGYRSVYEIKGRDFTKPLAFLIESFDDIRNYSIITDAQMRFLQNYPVPFTLLVPPKEGILPKFLDPNQYRLIGLRIAEICIDQETRSTLRFPLFLTSANRSGEKECKDIAECGNLFKDTDVHHIIIDGGTIENPPSNIFSFIGDSTEIEYLRKNYEA